MSDLNEEILQRVETAMLDFREGMQSTHDLSVRIGIRTTQFLRIFVLSMFILGVALLYLIISLKQDMSGFVDQMSLMNQNVQQMTESVGHMQSATAKMVVPLGVMPEMNQQLAGMSRTINTLNEQITIIAGQMSSLPLMSNDVNIMTKEIDMLLGEIRQMNDSLGRMAYDMDDISRPMRIFP